MHGEADFAFSRAAADQRGGRLFFVPDMARRSAAGKEEKEARAKAAAAAKAAAEGGTTAKADKGSEINEASVDMQGNAIASSTGPDDERNGAATTQNDKTNENDTNNDVATDDPPAALPSPSFGKAASSQRVKRLQSRASHSPYAKATPRTPRQQGTDNRKTATGSASVGDRVLRSPLAAAASAATATPSRPPANVTSPRSSGMWALSSIAGILSPFRSRARHSAAFGNPDEVDSDAVRSPQACSKGKGKEEQKAEEESLQDEEDVATQLYPSLPSAPLEAPTLDVTLASIDEESSEPYDDDSAEVSPHEEEGGETRREEDGESVQDELAALDELTQYVDDSIVDHAPQQAAQLRKQAEEQAQFQEQASAHTSLYPFDRVAQATGVSKQPSDQDINLPSVPHSPPHLPGDAGLLPVGDFPSHAPAPPFLDQSHFNFRAANQSRDEGTGTSSTFAGPSASTPFPQSTGFGAHSYTTPSRMGFGQLAARPVESPFRASPVRTLGRPGAFTFGSLGESTAPQLPAYPRAIASGKLSSPLAKNYELLARFFAEKAEAEAAGEASITRNGADETEDEDMPALGGLSEVETAGCLRLIEQSVAQGRGAEVERLRNDALERGRLEAPSSIPGEDMTRYPSYHCGRMSRSPSLPLGAAADELPVDYDLSIRSRPSSSFLAPSHVKTEDVNINRSLTSAFVPSPAPPKRRHRPLYLGPGVGASATSDALRRNQLAQQRRAALQNHRRMQQSTLSNVKTDGHGEETSYEAHPKKRRVQNEDSGEARAKPTSFLPTAQETRGAASLYHKPVEKLPPTAPQQARQNAMEKKDAAHSPPPQRTLTADAMLSILRSSPSIPVRQSLSTGKAGESPSTKRPTNPDLINPYEAGQRRSVKRSSLAPSSTTPSSLVSKEKERLKEERERRQRELKEQREAKKESTLELIQRTAPTSRRSGRRIRLESENEEEQPNTATSRGMSASGVSSSAVPTKERQGAQRLGEETDRAQRTREVQRRMEALKSNKATSAPSPSVPESAAALPSGSTTAKGVSEAAAAQKSVGLEAPSSSELSAAPKPFTFSPAFAPKKPSPLSQSANQAPDSPSTASEVSEKEFGASSRVDTASPFKIATPDVSKPMAAKSSFSFQFTQSAAESAPSAPATKPLFSFGTSSIAPSGPTASSGLKNEAVATPATGAEQAPADKARQVPPNVLPKFDFALNVLASSSTGSKAPPAGSDESARKAALASSPTALPSFSFGNFGTDRPLKPEESKKSAGGVSKATFSFGAAASPSTASAPASTSAPMAPFSLKPLSPSDSATTNEPTANGASGSTTADGDMTSGKATSALLSGVGEGEEDEDSAHEVRCKIWSLESGKWNDLGIGNMKIKKHKTSGKRRVLVRNEGNGKVTVNFRILPTFKPNIDKNVVSFLGFTAVEGKPMNYRCKIKTDDGARELKDAMEREAKAAE